MWTSALLPDPRYPSRLRRAEKAPVHHKDLFLDDCEERQKQKELLKSLIDTLARESKKENLYMRYDNVLGVRTAKKNIQKIPTKT